MIFMAASWFSIGLGELLRGRFPIEAVALIEAKGE
jgi:hypothetical protein